LRFTAGTDNGLTSPGHAVLAKLPSGDFAVDSFFDINYQIEFEGCPASPLEDYTGTTTDTAWRSTCPEDGSSVPDDPSLPEIITSSHTARPVPNPFGSSTTITYTIARHAGNARVVLNVYDATGQRIRTLADLDRPPGRYRTFWDGLDQRGRPAGGGVYFYQLRVGEETLSGLMVLLR